MRYLHFSEGTCPTIQSSDKKASDCANECSSDDDCQYDRICCTNECGGRTCSDSVEMCQVKFMSANCLRIKSVPF